MILRPALATLALLAVTPAAHADKFYFGSADTAKKMQAGTPDVVEGVLLKEQNGSYVIRIEGGEVTVAKSMVYKIEKDGLTLAQIVGREKATATQLAQANLHRREVRAAEASARRSARAHDATARAERQDGERNLQVTVDFRGLLPNYTFRTYDPVLHRVDVRGIARVVEDYLRAEVERAARRRR